MFDGVCSSKTFERAGAGLFTGGGIVWKKRQHERALVSQAWRILKMGGVA
jgi:hypothetical protein